MFFFAQNQEREALIISVKDRFIDKQKYQSDHKSLKTDRVTFKQSIFSGTFFLHKSDLASIS